MEREIYEYHDALPTCSNVYLWPVIQRIIAERKWPDGRKAFDLGCGNGATTNMLANMGFAIYGADSSESGIKAARTAFPNINVAVESAYDDLASRYGQFPLVVSLEVVEHCFEPRRFAKTLYNLVAPSGIAIVSTPYHSYLKNLALAISGKMDSHFTALWDGGHVKFFSVKTLGALLREAGFSDIQFERAGRVPALAKSMVAIAQKPSV